MSHQQPGDAPSWEIRYTRQAEKDLADLRQYAGRVYATILVPRTNPSWVCRQRRSGPGAPRGTGYDINNWSRNYTFSSPVGQIGILLRNEILLNYTFTAH